MKKDLLTDEKIQTKIADQAESQTLQKCCEQDSKEKSDVASRRSRAVNFLELTFDNEETTLICYQYSRLFDDQWTAFVPYQSYVHFSSFKPDLKSIIMGSLENLELGVYRFKLLSVFKYHYYWYQYIYDPELDLEDYPILEIRVFEDKGVKGFEVIDCYDIEEKIVKNEI